MIGLALFMVGVFALGGWKILDSRKLELEQQHHKFLVAIVVVYSVLVLAIYKTIQCEWSVALLLLLFW